jgi:hypothetical protein
MFTIAPKPVAPPEPDFTIGAGSTVPSLVVSPKTVLTELPQNTLATLYYRPRAGGIRKQVIGRIKSHKPPELAFDLLDTEAGDFEAYIRLEFSATEKLVLPFGNNTDGTPKRYWLRFSANAF